MANRRRFVMAAAIGLREDFDAKALRALAKRAKDGPRARRLLALAAIYDGATRSEQARSRILKKLPWPPGGDRPPERRRGERHRDMVRRRGARRPEEQDHAALGETRLAPLRAQGPAHRLDLHLRRDLPQGRQGRGARPAEMRHLRDEPAFG